MPEVASLPEVMVATMPRTPIPLPSAGTIHLDGQTLTALSEEQLPAIRRWRVGFIFQDLNLMSALTARDNVARMAELTGPPRPAARETAAALLELLGLGAWLHLLPEKLAGGEKQRAAIARAQVNDPALILAGEPTANLDSKIGHEILCLLRRIAKEQERSVVIVSHEQRIMEIAARVLGLEDDAFQDMVTMAIDPVSAMAVERENAETVAHDGVRYAFCSRGCRDEFLADPQQFAENHPPARSP